MPLERSAHVAPVVYGCLLFMTHVSASRPGNNVVGRIGAMDSLNDPCEAGAGSEGI